HWFPGARPLPDHHAPVTSAGTRRDDLQWSRPSRYGFAFPRHAVRIQSFRARAFANRLRTTAHRTLWFRPRNTFPGETSRPTDRRSPRSMGPRPGNQGPHVPGQFDDVLDLLI